MSEGGNGAAAPAAQLPTNANTPSATFSIQAPEAFDFSNVRTGDGGYAGSRDSDLPATSI